MSIRFLHRTYGILFFMAVMGILFAFGMPAMRASSQSDGFSDFAGGDKGQIEVVLHADQAPAPGGVANFTFAMKPWLDAPDLRVIWQLPEGGELSGGAAEERFGAVAAGATVTQTRQLRFPNPGIYSVRVRAEYQPDSATTLSAVGVLFFTIDANGSTASDMDPRNVPYHAPAFKPTFDKSNRAVAAGTTGPNAPAGCFKVHGILTREDRQGFPNPARYVDATGNAAPVHNVQIEMREEDTFSDDSYGYTITDANGYWEFNFCDDDGFLNDELELYTRVCSEVWDGTQIARIIQSGDNETYCFDSGTSDSEGGDVDFGTTNYKVNSTEAALFNIGDSVYWATKFWNNNLSPGVPRMDRSVNIQWDRADNFAGAYYTQSTTTIRLGDNPSDPDEWDDSVIIHEWGHFADHQFSCNNSPAGNHSYNAVNSGPGGDRLAWSEGWGDYLQSAVRTIIPGEQNADFYLDINTANVSVEKVGKANALSEAGVTSLLWDFFDNANDGSDTVNHGHARIEQVFTDPSFQGNPTCNMNSFLKSWKSLGMPTDAATAATVVQNVNIAKPFGLVAAASGGAAPQVAPLSLANLQALNVAPPYDYRWWNQITMVVDNSSSMADPAGTPKIDAVKTLIKDQISDGEKNPRGTEFDIYNFNAGGNEPTPVLEGGFFGKQINPVLDGLQANGTDAGCPVYGLYALSQATKNKYDGQAWLYTDGDDNGVTSVSFYQQQLNNRLVRGSVVLLGGCSAAPTDERSVTGPEESFLGVAADGLNSTGIVPYLLTAIGTGGSFLSVAPDQLANATDILRAQASHSAGAGGWSDYVSTVDTYRWDRLASWEYNWITPVNRKGQSVPSSLEIIGLPTMVVYGTPYNKVQIARYGSIHMGEPTSNANPLSHDLDVLSNLDMNWYYDNGVGLAAATGPDANAGYRQDVYADEVGDWVVFTVSGLADDDARSPRAYQALVNKITGEIRYQYQAVAPADSGGALIGVSESNFVFSYYEGVYASSNSASGAVPGIGYKFTPAPPQPSKSYTVSVDSKMSGVGFLLTGYSGSFNPMSIVDPNGVAVDCADTANVLCLNLGLVQYVQVNVNGTGGKYVATVSGQGTFSFNAMAASAIRAKGLGRRTLSLDQQFLQVDFGGSADNGLLNGWLQTPAGARFGSPLAFFDDGAHSDGGANDGVFGSEGFTPPGRGVAYLWVQGAVNGEEIVRSDPTPYNFQPIVVQPNPEYVQGFVGSVVSPGFTVTNQDSVRHCYYWEMEVPEGFVFDGSSGSPFCVDPGDTGHPNATFHYPMSDISGGVTTQMGADFFETEKQSIVGSTSTTVAMFRPLQGVAIENRHEGEYLRPNSTDSVTMSVNLLDDQGNISGWSGTLGYTLNTTLGSVVAPTGTFVGGRMPIVFSSGSETGTALITFVLEGGAVATTTMEIRNPLASEIELVATPTDLRDKDQKTSALVATLRDAWGDPVVGQSVRLAVSDDDGRDVNGKIGDSTVFTGTTDANGQVTATFTKGTGKNATFIATVRAEALVAEGADLRVSHEDSEELILTTPPPPPSAKKQTFLPFARGD